MGRQWRSLTSDISDAADNRGEPVRYKQRLSPVGPKVSPPLDLVIRSLKLPIVLLKSSHSQPLIRRQLVSLSSCYRGQGAPLLKAGGKELM